MQTVLMVSNLIVAAIVLAFVSTDVLAGILKVKIS